MPRRATNLDPHPVRFVGRSADLAALEARLEAERLVTVLGAPGTGKTRLARELGERRARAGGAVWLSDLTEATDADGICASVTRALSIALTTAGTTRDTVTRIGHLLDARGPLLLILDNFEQVVAHAAATVGVWLRMAPEARVLVASRQRLGLPGEALFDLGPLSLPEAAARSAGALAASEAVQLFVERARAVRRDYALSEADAPAVADLVRHLDGLPLAIELAAARMRLLSPAQILQHLPRRFQLLKSDGADVSPAGQASRPDIGRRQATLRGAIDWSWDLLTPWEQAALAQCSVFRGGFGPEAAEAVIDLSSVPAPAAGTEAPWTLDVLQSLSDKSLLFSYEPPAGPAGAESRFALYVSIRAYAAEKLAELDLEAETMARHAAHFLRIGKAASERLDSSEGPTAAWRLGLEIENLTAVFRRAMENSAATGAFRVGSLGPVLPPERATAALEAALVLAPWLSVHGTFGLCLSILDTALAAVAPPPGKSVSPAVDPALRARALEARGGFKRLVGRTAEGLADCEAAREIAEKIGRGPLLASVLQSLGWPLIMQGRPLDARARYTEALEIFRAAEGAASAEAATAARRAAGRCLSGIGDTFFWFAEARPSYEAALAIHRAAGDRRFEAFTLCKLGAVEAQETSHVVARGHLDEALRLARSTGDRRCEAVTTGCLALLEHDLGRLDAAREHYDRALQLHREVYSRWFEGIFLGYQGALHFEEGRLEEARALLEEAARIDREVGWSPYEGLVMACLGALYATLGELGPARQAFERASSRLEGLGRPELPAAVAILASHLELASGPAGLATARARIAEGEAFARRSLDVRFALRMLSRAIGQRAADPSSGVVPAPAPSTALADALVVAESGRWFQAPRAERVSLQRRRALHLIVKALADLRQSAAGTALTVEGLLEKGWPGERVHPEAGADRVYMALSTLRKLGLREVLVSRDDGYLLDPRVHVVRAPE